MAIIYKMKPFESFKYSIIQLFVILNCFCGCIDEYKAKGIKEATDILVVEGVITDYESIITLSRSANISEEHTSLNYVDNAQVYVECDDGTQWSAENGETPRNGQYLIKTGELNPNNQYHLKIEIKELAKTYEYYSDYSHPIKTPEIDSIFYVKRGKGQPVMMYVDTHSPDNKKLYYRWSYSEDWEVNATVYLEGYPFYCWGSSKNDNLLLGSAERTVYGQLADVLTEIDPADMRFSELYRIIVKQNVVSKRAYDYYLNIKKNVENMGSIFAPIPSELRGNITCITDPKIPVIGYIDVSSTTQKRRYIQRYTANIYEPPPPPLVDCEVVSLAGGMDPAMVDGYILFDKATYTWIQRYCVDCRVLGGATQKPDDWPR